MPRPRVAGGGGGVPAASTRTTRLAAKSELNVTPVENKPEKKTVVKTPMNLLKLKASQKGKLVGFPDRLNWKMACLKMPTTSTPKVDMTTKQVTRRDVDTAFGFDDSCGTSDVDVGGANYSTVISPIPHSSPKNGGVWKINPLTQRNVEIELPRPLPNVRDGESEKDRRKQNVNPKAVIEKKAPAASATSSHQPKPSNVADVDTIVISPTNSIPGPELEEVTKATKSTPDDGVHIDSEVKPTAPEHTRKPQEAMSTDIQPTRRRGRPKKSVAKLTDLNQVPPTISVKASSSTARDIQPRSTRGRSKKSVIEIRDSSPVSTTSQGSVASAAKASTRKEKSKPTSRRTAKSGTSKNTKRRRPLLFEDSTDLDEPSPFSALLVKYNEDPKADQAEGDLHVDASKIVRTYGSRKRVKFSEDRESEFDFLDGNADDFNSQPIEKKGKKRKASSKKPTSKGNAKKQEALLEEEAERERWLEEKNKEFEDVLKAPLVIENSFSE